MKLFIIIGVLCLTTVYSIKLPNDFPRCKAGDTECLKRVISEVIVNYKVGLPSINLPSIDPFTVPKIDIIDGGSAFKLNMSYTNLKFEGLSNLVFHKIVGYEKDPTKSKFETYAKTPQLNITGDYLIDGRVLILPIKGNGKITLNMEEVDLALKFLPKITQKKGKYFVQVEKLKFNADISNMRCHLTNLFNGDKTLGDNMNLFLNENWRELYAELKPALLDGMAQIIKSLINAIFLNLSYDDIWLDD